MVVYTVHEPPQPRGSLLEQADALLFVKEGFSWLAFLVPLFWLIWHRMWHVLAAWLGALIIAEGLIEALGLGDTIASWAAITINLIMGLEGNELRRWTLERADWRLLGAVSGRRLDDCVRTFFSDWLPSARAIATPPAQP